ncbi:MAG: T9SS type A sorting domain-containing protein, partial [Bacteroidia bacterium]
FGQGESARIDREDEIEYRIRFQNTGSDTAFAVVIVDTLSELLDVESLRFTGNSHDYSYEIIDRVLTVTFNPIILPDSTTNLEESIGYIRFAIKQNEDNPNNYVVANFADIYFDFNPPIRTNTEIRTIGEVALNNSELLSTDRLKVFPVPASEYVQVQLPIETNEEFNLTVYDLSGRTIKFIQVNSNLSSINISNLNSGIYFIEANTISGKTFTNKFIVQHN